MTRFGVPKPIARINVARVGRRGLVLAALGMLFLPASALGGGRGFSRAARLSVTPAPAGTSWYQGWPMDQHDPQHTNRAGVVGPTTPRLQWSRPGFAPELVGPEGDIYGTERGRVEAVDSRGRLRWSLRPNLEPVAVAPNGDLLAMGFTPTGSTDAGTVLVAYRPSGRRDWRVRPFGTRKGPPSAVVSSGGRLYAPLSRTLAGTRPSPTGYGDGYGTATVVVGPRGRVKRILPGAAEIALGHNGDIYAYSPDYRLERFDPAGRLLWRKPACALNTCGDLVVGPNDEVFTISPSGITAYSSRGQRLWTYAAAWIFGEMPDGGLLVGNSHTVTALSAGGVPLWSVDLGGNPAGFAAVTIDALGKCYVGVGNGTLRVISAEGKLLSTVSVGQRGPDWSGVPAAILGPSGDLLVDGPNGLMAYR